MIFEETRLPGAYRLSLEKRRDDRGLFARAFCREEFRRHGLDPVVAQANLSRSRRRGTVRGLHLQLPPAAEDKTVRCTGGAIYDVIVDLRPDSPSHGDWLGVELTAENHEMLYVPKGFGHGFQTLTDQAEVFYLVSRPYAPDREWGVRWNDPAFAIEWPLEPTAVSEKDRAWPDYRPRPELKGLPG